MRAVLSKREVEGNWCKYGSESDEGSLAGEMIPHVHVAKKSVKLSRAMSDRVVG
jgi:hypothetical protein